ncbi:hypothetical protein [Actinomadura verrucosospora]|uniref:Homogentisate 1,2-dioxygenase n=1 Tax=Actinomadura verrucosospora TaxID=46165 RepID=A0A7D3ZZF9_ACTVE|nr:hypothetical protein [Actinomadura verrucosospora]QKG18805.1 homogentisate 1,2-dioxygenase [Actinomadura verrucosospora]
MGTVKESFEAFPFDAPPRVLRRREEQLLGDPHTPPGAPRIGRDHTPIEVVHFDAEYVRRAFAPPRGVYEGDTMRLEWQTMNGRQPFYHRNCDVDEMSFQVAGVRSLMTEIGSVDLVPGDFSRIPVGVAHDNYGREDIHILFYVPAPVLEAVPAERTSEAVIPPFDGWEPAEINEMVTECLAGPGHDVVLAPADERALLEQAEDETDRIQVLRPGDASGTTWLYRSSHVLIGRTAAESSDGRVYRRIRNAEEIQYQISGRRTLVTQRGTVLLEPGDFVKVPVGIAFTSIHHEPSAHLTVASAREVPQVSEATRTAERLPAAEIEALR